MGARVHDIEAVELRTHPLVLELTGKRSPRTGLEGKFSVYHSAACALLRGDGAPTAYTDEVVNLPELVALRDRVTAVADPACHEASVDIAVTFADGNRVTKHVERAIGSRERPLSDAEIEHKFCVQSGLVIGDAAAARLLDLAWRLETLADSGEVARMAMAG
ncbi:hypothetical protein D1122_08510 [Cereibacter sphaeroides]|uniref:MmgE/PrpD family protein n=1 Tax=Cereibacter sphaeroides TaxID=1063 RepID=UPI000E5A4F65|nr:MmgE/PrpD family protein [Cereibacter sphaeroides]RHZ98991.1 hypothetical protein D1122_08510 [Cereibacter sphaeroides]